MTVNVRKASYLDMSPILEFAKAKHEASNYSNQPFNAVIARRSLKEYLGSHMHRVFVAVRGTREIVGLLIAERGPMPWTAGQCATDIVFVADHAGDRLLDAFLEWCRLCKVARIDMGISQLDSNGRPDKRADRLYRRKGLIPLGGMYYLPLEANT